MDESIQTAWRRGVSEGGYLHRPENPDGGEDKAGEVFLHDLPADGSGCPAEGTLQK